MHIFDDVGVAALKKKRSKQTNKYSPLELFSALLLPLLLLTIDDVRDDEIKKGVMKCLGTRRGNLQK